MIERLAVRARIALDPLGGRPGQQVRGVAPERELPDQAGPRARARSEPRSRADLTPREREILALLGSGRSNDEIGEILYVSGKTVSVHITNIKAKLGASSRVEIALYAIESGVAEGRAPASG
jgi:DNA-binding CsgD family transcriptional regulator